jgi:hypothetical protein
MHECLWTLESKGRLCPGHKRQLDGWESWKEQERARVQSDASFPTWLRIDWSLATLGVVLFEVNFVMVTADHEVEERRNRQALQHIPSMGSPDRMGATLRTRPEKYWNVIKEAKKRRRSKIRTFVVKFLLQSSVRYFHDLEPWRRLLGQPDGYLPLPCVPSPSQARLGQCRLLRATRST